MGSDSYGIVRTLVEFDWGVDAEPASDMLVSNLIWGPVVTDARMVCDVIINLKEEREEVKWCARGNEIKPIHLQSARIGNPQRQICAIHVDAPAYFIFNFHLFPIADEAVDMIS